MDMLHYAKTHKTIQRSYLHSPLVLFHWMIHLKLRYLQNMDTALLELHLGYSIKKLIFDDQILSGTNDTVSQARKSS